MDAVLHDVSVLAGVLGVFLCDSAGSVLAAHPASLEESPEHAEAGRAVAAALASLAALAQGLPDEIDLTCERGRLIVKSAGSGACLAILCQPSVNALLLKLKTAVAVKALAKELEARQRERARADLNERVRKAVEAVLGPKAGKPLALVAAAGEAPEQLAAAGAEAVRFAKLFVGQDRADELARRLRLLLGRGV